jgi:hypothetical protein
MKIDLYTKTVLTIIALCLVWLCVRGSLVSQTVQAAGVQDVRIVSVEVPDPTKAINTNYIQTLKARNLTDSLRVSDTSK